MHGQQNVEITIIRFRISKVRKEGNHASIDIHSTELLLRGSNRQAP